MKLKILSTSLTLALFLSLSFWTKTFSAEPTKSETNKVADLSNPRDAGVRYGQAAGMSAVCENMQPTQKAEALASAFSGEDLETFKVQAESVLQSWKKTLTCTHTNDPNPCRLAHQISCREGLKEIGPAGTIAPGLVEVKPTEKKP